MPAPPGPDGRTDAGNHRPGAAVPILLVSEAAGNSERPCHVNRLWCARFGPNLDLEQRAAPSRESRIFEDENQHACWLTAGFALVAGGAIAQERVVNVYNWSDYIDEDVLKQFTEETGIKVVYDVYDNNDIVETKLLAGGSGYDIVVPTDSNMSRQIKAGVLMPLDKSKLPNLVHMWPFVMDRLATYDPDNQHAVDYMWGTTGIGINVDMVEKRLGGEENLDTWATLFDPANAAKLADCGIHIMDAPEDVVQSVLAWQGKNPDSKDPADIEAAGEVLKAIRPYIQKFHSSEYINALANGDICVAMGYSGDILQARDRADEAGNGVNIEYLIPREGALMWFDCDGHPGRRAAPGRGPRVHQLHDAARRSRRRTRTTSTMPTAISPRRSS